MKKLLLLFIFVTSQWAFATDYYVSTKGNDKNDGKSEAKAWRTISHAAEKAESGDTVWIKAGNYGKELVVIDKSGKKNKPISFIGYKNKIGDIKSMYYSYAKGKSFDANQMPLLDGNNRANGEMAITLDKTEYIVIKNIQIKNYRWGIHGGRAAHALIEGVLASNFGDIKNSNESGYGAEFKDGGNNEFKNCIFINATGANLRIEGDHNLIDKVKSYADDNSTHEISATDYYIHINGGNNNIIRNSYIERVGNLEHTGHGFGLKYDCKNNLIENCESVNVKGAIELRHHGVQQNIIRNILIKGPMGSITIRDGASNNTIENITVKNSNEGIRFYDQTESGQGGNIASDNIIKNSVFIDIGNFIVSAKANNVRQDGNVTGNKVINCTVYGADNLFETQLSMNSSNELINTILQNVKGFEDKQSVRNSKWSISYCNLYKNGFSNVSGSGNISKDPQFENVGKDDFRLTSGSALIDAGVKDKEVSKDFDGNNRPKGSSHDIGAFEYQKNSSSSIKAYAGEDQNICPGEKVTLTASGGSKYEWSNGATTKTITVAPSKTTTYSVKVSDGKLSDKDEVTVNVESVSANAGKDVVITEGQRVTLTATGGDKYEWSTGELLQSITVSPKKTKVYSVKVSKGGCEVTDEVKVTVNKSQVIPVVAFAGDDITICKGEEVTLKASGGTEYTWDHGATGEKIKVSPEKTTTYTVTVSDGITSATDEVTVHVNNVVANAGKDVKIEEGESVTLTASGGDSYQWSTGETTKSITVNPIVSATYTVKAIKDGCEDSDKIKVQVVKGDVIPVVAFAGDDITICKGEEVTLKASGGTEYTWDHGATGEKIKVSPEKTTTYTVTVSDGITSATDEVTVHVNNVVANAGKDVTLEEGGSVTLTATGGDKYEWSTGETTKSIMVNPSESTIYAVKVIKDGCEDSDKVKVNVVKGSVIPVVAYAGEDVTICNGEEIVLKASGGTEYTWDHGVTGEKIKVSPEKTTTYTVTVSDGITSATDEVTVHVNNVVANAGKDVKIEEGESVTLTASGGDSYQWSTGETTKSITVNPIVSATYTVKAIKDGCEDSDKVKVQVVKGDVIPVVALAGDDITICKGEEVTLEASGGTEYTWDHGATGEKIKVSPEKTTTYTVTVSDGITSATDEVTVHVNSVVANAGKDVTLEEGESVTLTASGGDSYQWSTGETTKSIRVNPTKSKSFEVIVFKDGCSAQDIVKVNVTPKAPQHFTVDAGEDVKICPGESVVLTASKGSTYLWSTGANTRSITVNPKATAEFSVEISNGVNTGSDDVRVIVNQFDFSVDSNKTILEGDSITLKASGAEQYLWNTGETTQSITVNPKESTIYSVTGFQGLCQKEEKVQVIVNKRVIENNLPSIADAGMDVTICLGESVILKANGGLVYEWSTGDTRKDVKVSPKRTTIYELKATRGGVTTTDTVVVNVEQCKNDSSEDEVLVNFTVFPNPSDGMITLNIDNVSDDLKLAVFDLNGRLIHSEKVNGKYNNFNKQLDFSRFSKGIYLIKLYNQDTNLTKKILLV